MISGSVQWIGADGGWKTGFVMCLRAGVRDIAYPVVRQAPNANFTDMADYVLVEHDCTRQLEFVEAEKLQRRRMRSEYENPSSVCHPPSGEAVLSEAAEA